MATGRCLCRGVHYEIAGALAQPIACHCWQCARTSGNFAAMAACKSADLEMSASKTLSWYQSSQNAQRGFCPRCGGNVFWKAAPGVETYITAELSIGQQAFVSASTFMSARNPTSTT